jgi:pantothenate kinase type III
VERCRKQAPADARLLLTGGDASVIAAGIAGPHELIPDLVLEGLGGTLDGV